MRIKSPVLFLLFILSSLFLFELFITSCATRSAPSGGPRDSIAPVVDTSFPPNMSTNFNAKEVTLVFNEYVQLKSPSQQISFSPPLRNKPTIRGKGKEVVINWEPDTLLENTTYIISFGTSIADFTEGNINEDLKYVFSTGDFIDSLGLQGSVKNSSDGEPTKEIMVALYDYSTVKGEDSIPFHNLPTYYTYTSEDGYFELSNLKYGKFHVVAFEDARGNFKMSTGTEKVAFIKDTLITALKNERLDLFAFQPKSPNRYYGARHSAPGKVQVAFNYIPKKLKFEFLDSAIQASFLYQSLNQEKDTATLWFDSLPRDSLKFIVFENEKVLDTALVEVRNFKPKKLNIKVKHTDVKYNEPIQLMANKPLRSLVDTLIWVYGKDTVAGSGQIQTNPLRLSVEPAQRYDTYKIHIKSGAVEDIFGNKNDSILVDLKNLKREDLGNLDFTIKTDTVHSLILHMFNPDGERIVDSTFTGNITIPLHNMMPGVYETSLIVDENGDGKWTTGNYLEGRQPEVILTYKETVEIRANWDLELEWTPEIPEN